MPTVLRLLAIILLASLVPKAGQVVESRAFLAADLGLPEPALVLVAVVLLAIGAFGAIQLWRLHPSGLLICRVFAAASIPLVILKYAASQDVTAGGVLSILIQVALAVLLFSPAAGRACGRRVHGVQPPTPAAGAYPRVG
jgi:hypothetical protein